MSKGTSDSLGGQPACLHSSSAATEMTTGLDSEAAAGLNIQQKVRSLKSNLLECDKGLTLAKSDDKTD